MKAAGQTSLPAGKTGAGTPARAQLERLEVRVAAYRRMLLAELEGALDRILPEDGAPRPGRRAFAGGAEALQRLRDDALAAKAAAKALRLAHGAWMACAEAARWSGGPALGQEAEGALPGMVQRLEARILKGMACLTAGRSPGAEEGAPELPELERRLRKAWGWGPDREDGPPEARAAASLRIAERAGLEAHLAACAAQRILSNCHGRNARIDGLPDLTDGDWTPGWPYGHEADRLHRERGWPPSPDPAPKEPKEPPEGNHHA